MPSSTCGPVNSRGRRAAGGAAEEGYAECDGGATVLQDAGVKAPELAALFGTFVRRRKFATTSTS
jgi:hypothetical protein